MRLLFGERTPNLAWLCGTAANAMECHFKRKRIKRRTVSPPFSLAKNAWKFVSAWNQFKRATKSYCVFLNGFLGVEFVALISSTIFKGRWFGVIYKLSIVVPEMAMNKASDLVKLSKI